MITLADMVEALTNTRPIGTDNIINEAVVDSRLVLPGSLFVAFKGERVDGHDYVRDAFINGASYALIEKEISSDFKILDLSTYPDDKPPDLDFSPPLCFKVQNTLTAIQQIAHYWRRKLDVRVIGITGSVGKSTTKEIVANVLSKRYSTLRSPGNLNNEIGLPLTIFKLDQNHERAVLEMGFYIPGEIALLCDIAQPQIGVVCNIGMVHASRAGSQEAIFQGKSELVQALPKDGVAILNYDDQLVRKMSEKTNAKVFFYGLDPASDLWADEIEGMGLDGIRFNLHYHDESMHLHLPMIGQHSVHTALRATAVGLVENLPWQEILEGLQMGHNQLRLNTIRAANGALILDDTYNASPESTLAALNLLAELEGRRVAVLGDMLELGPYEQLGHEMVGVRAAQVAEILITVGELGQLIALSARNAGMNRSQVFEFKNTEETADFLPKIIKEQDVILIKGSHSIRMDLIVTALETNQ